MEGEISAREFAAYLLLGALSAATVAGGVYLTVTGLDAPYCTEWKWPKIKSHTLSTHP